MKGTKEIIDAIQLPLGQWINFIKKMMLKINFSFSLVAYLPIL